MARAKQPALAGSSPSASALGAIFSISGPNVSRWLPTRNQTWNLLKLRVFVQHKGRFTRPLFFCRGNPVEGVHVVHARPELAYFTDKNFDMRGCAASLPSMLWEKYDSDMMINIRFRVQYSSRWEATPKRRAKPL